MRPQAGSASTPSNRTIRVLALVVTLLLTLAACGTNDDSGQAQGEAQAGSEAAGGEVSGDLTIWAMGAEGERLGEFADMFAEEYPDVNASVTPIAWGRRARQVGHLGRRR